MSVSESKMLLWDLVLRWYCAECDIAQDPVKFPPPRAVPIQFVLDVAYQRVVDVICGEVRWSEAGPGDRAVWEMRTRSPEQVREELTGARKDFEDLNDADVRELREDELEPESHSHKTEE